MGTLNAQTSAEANRDDFQNLVSLVSWSKDTSTIKFLWRFDQLVRGWAKLWEDALYLDPDAGDIQNLTSSFLSKATSVVKLTWTSG